MLQADLIFRPDALDRQSRRERAEPTDDGGRIAGEQPAIGRQEVKDLRELKRICVRVFPAGSGA